MSLRTLKMKGAIFGLVFFVAASLVFGHGQSGKTTAIRGEVIDVTCYLMHPSTGKGAGHKECALKCVTKNGLPVGILEEKTGNVYLVVDASHRAADLSQYVAQIVTLEGSIHRGKGVNLFVMKGIKK